MGRYFWAMATAWAILWIVLAAIVSTGCHLHFHLAENFDGPVVQIGPDGVVRPDPSPRPEGP